MAITTGMCTSFKKELFEATHDFLHQIHLRLLCLLAAATCNLLPQPTPHQRISGSGYSAGGVALTVVAPATDGTSAIVDFNDPSWTSASFTANGALVYNSSKSNKAVAAFAFGGDQTVSSGTFTITIPAAASGTAVVRID